MARLAAVLQTPVGTLEDWKLNWTPDQTLRLKSLLFQYGFPVPLSCGEASEPPRQSLGNPERGLREQLIDWLRILALQVLSRELRHH